MPMQIHANAERRQIWLFYRRQDKGSIKEVLFYTPLVKSCWSSRRSGVQFPN